jgi:hypothetical protein
MMEKPFEQVKEEFVLFLRSLTGDNRVDIEKSVSYLLLLQKSRSNPPPPLAEIITIIKYDRPLLFGLLRQRFQSNLGMNILFQLELSFEQAKRKLNYK